MRKASLPCCFLADKETMECAYLIDGEEGGISIELLFLIGPGALGVSSESRAMRDEKLPHRESKWKLG
jgi:hypothetical protein